MITFLSYKALVEMGDRCEKKITELYKLVDDRMAKPDADQEASVAKLRELILQLKVEVAGI